MSKTLKDFISGLFFIAFSIFMYVVSYDIKVGTMDSLGGQFFPRLIAICIGLIALSQVIKALKDGLNSDEVKSSDLDIKKVASLIVTILILILYVATIKYLGFILVSILYLLVQIWVLTPKESKTKKRKIIIVVVSILTPILIYALFYNVFNIFLPTGLLG